MNRPLHIALLARAGSTHTFRWANALAERGAGVHLFSFDEPRELDPRVMWELLPGRPPRGYFLAAGRLRRRLHELRPDLLHAHYASGYGLLARLCRYRPLVTSVWGSDVYHFPTISPLHRAVLCGNLRAADWVCSTSRVMAERVRELAADVHRISITPFGVDLARFTPGPRKPTGGALTITITKPLYAEYGHKLLLRGFAQVQRRLHAEGRRDLADSLRLRIIGEGPYRAALVRLVEELGIAPAVAFMGRLPYDQIPEELAYGDIFAAPTLCRESFGVAVVEAMACELPVLVSDADGFREVVDHNRTGLITPRGDQAALTAALDRLVRDGDLRRRLGNAGRRVAAAHYDWRENVDRMLRVYRQALRRCGRVVPRRAA